MEVQDQMETELEGWEGMVECVVEKALSQWDCMDLQLEWRKEVRMT